MLLVSGCLEDISSARKIWAALPQEWLLLWYNVPQWHRLLRPRLSYSSGWVHRFFSSTLFKLRAMVGCTKYGYTDPAFCSRCAPLDPPCSVTDRASTASVTGSPRVGCGSSPRTDGLHCGGWAPLNCYINSGLSMIAKVLRWFNNTWGDKNLPQFSNWAPAL